MTTTCPRGPGGYQKPDLIIGLTDSSFASWSGPVKLPTIMDSVSKSRKSKKGFPYLYLGRLYVANDLGK